jgi:hypothetical protein
MNLTIDLIKLLAANNEVNKIEARFFEGLIGVQSCHSDKCHDQATHEQYVACFSNPINLVGISSFDFTELRNYIYGVNGRY